MLVLFETPAGFSIFKVLDDNKLKATDDIWKEFQSASDAKKIVKLKAFHKFENTVDALAATTSLVESKLGTSMEQFLAGLVKKGELKETLGVTDAKLGGLIKEKFGVTVDASTAVQEVVRGLRMQMDALLSGASAIDMRSMQLGLAHSLSRYKLKFSPDKVDTMIVQAINLLDDLDKELNTYCMRVREWYGWHFPEMGRLIEDHVQYARVIKKLGVRSNALKTDLSDILPEDKEHELREAAQISMGSEIGSEDTINIQSLCDQIIEISQYRAELYDYLKNRMMAIAPNLTILVGELVGARLIAHTGSLISLAKQPASTVQILGAEKALFRALKTKHETPKYGLIYHASLVGQAAPKLKGKISRVLAAKAALSIRVDALGDKDTPNIGTESRLTVENRLRQLEGKPTLKRVKVAPTPKFVQDKSEFAPARTYNADGDSAVPAPASGKKKREREEPAAAAPEPVKEAKTSKKEKEDKKAAKAARKAEKAAKKEAKAAKKEAKAAKKEKSEKSDKKAKDEPKSAKKEKRKAEKSASSKEGKKLKV